MNEQKLYAVKDDKGYYWEFKDLCGIDLGGFWELLDVSVPFTASEEDAKNTAKDHGGHVVELAEAPAKIVVSEEEADMLEQAKYDYCAASVISAYSTEHIGAMGQDRLMCAYVIGWEVEKPKRYLVRVPHTNRHYYYQKCDSGEVIPVWDMETEPPTQFTIAEIDHYGLQDCEKTEVEQDTE